MQSTDQPRGEISPRGALSWIPQGYAPLRKERPLVVARPPQDDMNSRMADVTAGNIAVETKLV